VGESWIVSNLNAALSTWNDKLAEIWSLLTESPQTFKGGQVWGTEKFRWGNTLCSFGCGYRFEFKNRMNIRLDYGWGNFGNQNLPWDRKRSSAFLFTASEAF